ncbi:MAG: hypothetical protein GY757_44425, partial [bacterium]|nr:hypothetical protein [bacterium]
MDSQYKNQVAKRLYGKRYLMAKLTLFLILIFFLQVLLSLLLLHFDSPDTGDYVHKFEPFTHTKDLLKEKTDIIYLGDSTICSRGKKDSDDRCISEMVRDMLPRYSLGRVTHEAYQMDLYLEFCKYICRQKNLPSIIIIPINMRSFAPGWDMKPQFQFEKETIILRGGLKRV